MRLFTALGLAVLFSSCALAEEVTAPSGTATTIIEGSDIVLRHLNVVRIRCEFKGDAATGHHEEAATNIRRLISLSLPQGVRVVDDPAVPLLKFTLSMVALPGGSIIDEMTVELVDSVRIDRIANPIWITTWECHATNFHGPSTSADDVSAGAIMTLSEVLAEFSAKWKAENPPQAETPNP